MYIIKICKWMQTIIIFYNNINLTLQWYWYCIFIFWQFISLLHGDNTSQPQNKLLIHNDFKHLGNPMSVYMILTLAVCLITDKHTKKANVHNHNLFFLWSYLFFFPTQTLCAQEHQLFSLRSRVFSLQCLLLIFLFEFIHLWALLV